MIRWFLALLNSISNQPERFTYRCCPRPKCRQTPDTTSDIGRVIFILHFMENFLLNLIENFPSVMTHRPSPNSLDIKYWTEKFKLITWVPAWERTHHQRPDRQAPPQIPLLADTTSDIGRVISIFHF